MQTIKTGVVVVLLLAVCYGAFVALNAPEPELPEELQKWAYQNEDLDNLLDIEVPSDGQMVSTDPASFGATPGGLNFDLPMNTGSSTNTPNASAELSLPTFDINGQPVAGSPPNSLAANPNTNTAAAVGLPTFPGPTGGFTSPAAPMSEASEQPGLSGLPMPSNGTFAATDGPAVSLASRSATGSADAKPPTTTVSTNRDLLGDSRTSVELPLLNADEPAASGQQAPALAFVVAREEALQKANSGKLSEALRQLSPYYDSPVVTHSEHSDLVDILDALSREVIYSTRNLVTSSHTATASDTVTDLAQQYNITPEFLAKVNQMGASRTFTPGSPVKVVQGPFRAKISLNRAELTLFLGDLYAGRFPVSFGNDPPPSQGVFEIVERRRDRTYYGRGGTIVADSDSRNPYGGYWLSLGHDLCIHGTAEMESSDLADAGCVSLAPLDAADVYDILTKGSQVEIVP